MPHAAFQRRAIDALEPVLRGCGRPSSEHELGDVPAFLDQQLIRVQQPTDVLPRLERAEEQDVAAVRRGGAARRPRRGSGRTDRELVCWDAKLTLHLPARKWR